MEYGDIDRQLVLMNSVMDREKKVSPKTVPDHFDVRVKFGKRCPIIKQVYNQGKCKSGWVNYLLILFKIDVC